MSRCSNIALKSKDEMFLLYTGWGKDSFGKDGTYQVILKQVELDMVDKQTCQNRLR